MNFAQDGFRVGRNVTTVGCHWWYATKCALGHVQSLVAYHQWHPETADLGAIMIHHPEFPHKDWTLR